jgi:hypothetical protein
MQSTSTKRREVPHKEVGMGDILTTTTREDSTQPLGETQLLSSLINMRRWSTFYVSNLWKDVF